MSKNENENDNTPPPSVDLDSALNQMNEAGTPPDGFHMMFFSEEFTMKEDCPTNQLLKKLGLEYNFADTIRRQVYQLPNDKKIISYEFAWLGDFNLIKNTMENVDGIIQDSFARMVSENTLTIHPKGRVQFLVSSPDMEGEQE